MDTFELLNVLKSDQAVGQIFLGVFPCDKLPPLFQKPSALVVNLDPSEKPGSHWVCMYFDKGGTCEFFDSYGNAPNEEMRSYILQHAWKMRYNKKCVQRLLASTCGQLCIYFLIWRCRGVPMKMIMDSLEKSYADEFVTGFVNNLFKLNTVMIDEDFIIKQISQQFSL